MTAVCRDLYLDLMKRALTNTIYADAPAFPLGTNFLDNAVVEALGPASEDRVKLAKFDIDYRAGGVDIPTEAHTMIGMHRLENIQHCVERVLSDNVPGDLIETGVWRGGACIFMRALLRSYEITDRIVWLADSFAGFPEPTEDSHSLDQEMAFHSLNWALSCAEETVRDNFDKYGLLDDQVQFLPGFFHETLPEAPIDRLAILRLDGDLYTSTRDALDNLYPKLSAGGFVIIDDYLIPACRRAVDEYREAHRIQEEVEVIDVTGVYWRRSA